MLFEKLRKRIIEYFRRRFYPFVFNLNDEYSDVLSQKNEIEKRNVLIGTIRRREQYPINISENFYHIPTKQILDDVGIEYVALYQSKTIFNQENDINGISRFARIVESKHLKRSDIYEIPSASNEDYIKFNVDKWNTLPQPITIREKYPKVFSKTSFYLLTNARFTFELYFESVNEYVFYLGVCDIIRDIYDGFEFLDMTVIRRGRKIKISAKSEKTKFKIKDFQRSPQEITRRIFAFLGQTT